MTKLLTTAAVLVALVAPATAEQPKLPSEFYELPQFIQREVKGIRAECPAKHEYEMSGINTFYLGQNPTILVDDRHVCDGVYKGVNCHTWGCDVRVYRYNGKEWEKILDEPVSQLFLSTSKDSAFILAALSFVGKYEEKCGKWNMQSPCDYLLSWKNGAWHWQKLQGEGQ